MKVLVFDTETTSLVFNHTLPLDKQAHVIEWYGAYVDLETGEIEKECHHIIKTPRPWTDEEKRIALKSHRFTEDELNECPYFAAVASDIKAFVEYGPRPLAHNCSFDLEITEIEFERLGQTIKWGGRPICTIESTIHLKGYRLNLGALHELLFGERFAEAHKAKNDANALIRVACELNKMGEI